VNLEALLARLDTATMAVGLEARVPFTDHHLIETALSLPRSLRIDVDPGEQAPFLASGELSSRGSLRSKRVLRLVADRMLPRDLARRPKASFPTPVADWLAGQWSRWAGETLRGSRFAHEVFEPAAVEALAARPATVGMWMWPILNLCQWGDRLAA
jgi:asparagine synthase (glutamine-hydrolysing)